MSGVHTMPRECFDAVLDALVDAHVENADVVARVAVLAYEAALPGLPDEVLRLLTLVGAVREQGDELVPVAERFRTLGVVSEWSL